MAELTYKELKDTVVRLDNTCQRIESVMRELKVSVDSLSMLNDKPCAIEDAAAMMNVSVHTMRKWAAQHDLNAQKINGRMFVSFAKFLAFKKEYRT